MAGRHPHVAWARSQAVKVTGECRIYAFAINWRSLGTGTRSKWGVMATPSLSSYSNRYVSQQFAQSQECCTEWMFAWLPSSIERWEDETAALAGEQTWLNSENLHTSISSIQASFNTAQSSLPPRHGRFVLACLATGRSPRRRSF